MRRFLDDPGRRVWSMAFVVTNETPRRMGCLYWLLFFFFFFFFLYAFPQHFPELVMIAVAYSTMALVSGNDTTSTVPRIMSAHREH